MALSKLTTDLDYHQSNPEEPSVPFETLQEGFDSDVNIIKDWINDTLTDEIDTNFDDVPTNSEVVLLTGDQSIDGVKTHTSFPVTPSTAPTTDYQVANKKYIDDTAIAGVGDGTITNTKLATDVKVGSLATLTTTEDSSVTGAINEVDAKNDSQDILIDSNQDRIGISNKIYTQDDGSVTVSGSEVTINTDGNLSDGEYGVPVQFKLTADVSSAELKVDTTTMTVCKDLDGDAIDLQANTLYIAYLVDDTTDFFALAPRGGGGIKAIYQGYTTTTPVILGTTSEVNIDNCLASGSVCIAGGDARNSTGYVVLDTSGGNVRVYASNNSVCYTVIEFDKPKIIEDGLVTLTASPTDVTLTNTFDITKKVMVGISYYHPGTSVSYQGMVRGEMLNNTTLRFNSTGTHGGANYGTAKYYVVQI